MLQIENWIDISVPLNKKTVCWPGTTFTTKMVSDKNLGEFATAHEVAMNVHCGTHIDAPSHHIVDGAQIHEVALSKMNGLCRVINCDSNNIDAEFLEKQEIKQEIKQGEIILLKTTNSKILQNGNFTEDYAALTLCGAKYLASKGISTVGIDYLSIQKFEDSPETHEVLLCNEIVILESIDLINVSDGRYELLCLPIKLTDVEAAPCRALIRKID